MKSNEPIHREVSSAPAHSLNGSHCFVGVWNVRRILVDHLTRTKHHFSGLATIDEGSFLEQGELLIGPTPSEAVRRYKLRMSEGGAAIMFPGGAEFIHLDLNAQQNVRHLCGDDFYAGRFFFQNADAWVEYWRVRGPRKRYASLTRYSRRQQA